MSTTTTTTTTTATNDTASIDIVTNKAASTDVASGDFETRLNFFYEEPPEGEKAYVYYFGRPGGGRPRNFELRGEQVVVHDARGKEELFSLDKSGFKYLNHVSEEKGFLDEDLITSRYYKEVEELLKKETGASRVVVFDHAVR